MGFTFVKEVMTKNVISIDSSMTVKDAAAMMDDANVGSRLHAPEFPTLLESRCRP